ncbi:RNA-binding protein 44 isoform 3-T5 [Anomaloglossus baeobatrachus]
MENSRRFEENYWTVPAKDYRMMQGSAHTDMRVQRDPLWFDVAADIRKSDVLPKKNNVACHAKSLHLENCDTLVGFGHKIFDKDSLIPLNFSHKQEKDTFLVFEASSLQSLAKETFPSRQCACNCQATSGRSSACDLRVKADENFLEHTFPALKICEDSETMNRRIKSKDSGLGFDDTNMELVQAEGKNIPPWPKCFPDVTDDPGDHDSSSVDLFEDETFFSVKSGSFYSRSSSPFSLDGSTDIEQCTFEEALEDLSSLSLDRQGHDSLIVPNANVHSQLLDTSIKYVKHPTYERMAKSAVSKQRSISCNTDLSWVSRAYDDKETQTRKSTQDIGINTETIQYGLYSQIPAPRGVGTAKDLKESKTMKAEQRAVKAELQLVDVHRWLCWQMCWKSQQQAIEKQTFFNLSKETTAQSTSVTNFNLSSALAEVEEKYQEMRAKIQSGTPLDTLVPLPMQVTTFEACTDNLLKDTCQHSRKQNVSDVPAEDLNGTKCVKNDFEDLSCVNKYEQKPNEIHSAEDLSKKPIHYYVHVGNIAPFVKEVQVMDVFQKYHVLNVFLVESSLTCSYAVLTFVKSEEAEAAMIDMDGKMFYGKKIKVRAIKTPNYNLSLAFQKIKSVPKDIPQDGKCRFEMFEPKEGSGSQPAKSDSTQRDHTADQTHAASVVDSLTNASVNMPNNGCPPMNTNLGLPPAPPPNSFGVYNCMSPNHQWMFQTPHSNMISFNSMPNFLHVPFSYPLYTLPNYPGFFPTVTHSPNFGINTKPNVNNQFGKGHVSRVNGKPGKPPHGTDGQSNAAISQSIVPNQVQLPTDKAELLKTETGVKFMEDKPATVKSVSERVSFTISSSKKLHRSQTASQENSLTMSVPEITAGARDVETPVIDCLSSVDEQNNLSGPPKNKSAAPLRLPTSVPPSVTIPEDNKQSVNPNFNSELLIYSEKQAGISSSVPSLERDSLPGGEKWLESAARTSSS